ncbi:MULTISPECIES: site-specific integrase [unclassified Breznakia]|uniref:tyrosine-type recombinase/integrase n=1 Tax=unclassified Breznakia TaxID=2623764 RepID=UPI002475FAFE|nr:MULTISPECIES: site-specific integrase [unclassified Breznakia]MDH6367518.1 integrase [Breznakia sp. PH1-1]MDH6404688.1 integrase [Breznakia sp. PF1-11]MDH6412348.1 integrase [Breznakia sp. PFB1-11]MDH6414686.1 integrase [Breznakia sp. PFB1-14]MDH6417069.1 integrase [Breznakia sp. PFB1-4]
MPVYQNKTTKLWYFSHILNGKQIIRKNKTWTRKKYAQEALDKFLNDVKENEECVINIRFNSVADEYIEHLKLVYRKSTVQGRTYVINKHIKPQFNNMKISKIKLKNIEGFQKYLLSLSKADGKPYCNAHLANIQGIASRIFEYAKNHDYITKNPFAMAVQVKHNIVEEKRDITILTYNEFHQFVDVVESPVERVGYFILYWCGLRSGELLGLHIKDYDALNKKLHVNYNWDYPNQVLTPTKTSEWRTVDVPDECASEIDKYLEEIPNYENYPDNPLIGFVTRYSKSVYEKHKKLDIKKSGVKHFTFHELRHTHVSTLIDVGWDAKDIADRLGHSVEMVNNTYGHLFPDRKSKNLEKLNKISKNH